MPVLLSFILRVYELSGRLCFAALHSVYDWVKSEHRNVLVTCTLLSGSLAPLNNSKKKNNKKSGPPERTREDDLLSVFQ